MSRFFVLTLCFSLMSCSSFFDGDAKEKATLHMEIGNGHFEQGNYPLALKEFLEAEKLDPNNPVVHNNLGLVYFMRERYELSEKQLRRALDLKSNYSDARNNLARIYLEQHRYAEAEKELKLVIDDLTYSGGDRAWLNFGLSRFNQKDWKGAQKAFEKSLQISRESCLANSYYGRTFFELGDYRKAAINLDKAVGFCQHDLFDEPHYYSALAWYRLGEKEKSMVRFQEIIKIYPEGKYREKSRAMLDLIGKGVE